MIQQNLYLRARRLAHKNLFSRIFDISRLPMLVFVLIGLIDSCDKRLYYTAQILTVRETHVLQKHNTIISTIVLIGTAILK